VTGEAVRFGIVGLIQNALNVAVFALATGAGVHYRIAAVLAALAALVVSFAFNRAWTFPGRGGPVHHQGARYALVFGSAVAPSQERSQAGRLVAASWKANALPPPVASRLPSASASLHGPSQCRLR